MRTIRSSIAVSLLSVALGAAPLSHATAGGEVLPAVVSPAPAPVQIPAAAPAPGAVGAAPATSGIPSEVFIIAAAAAALGLFIALAASDESGRGEPISPS